ncbi:RNA polymerase sigma factor [Chondromyces crocatus]|uniref:RNA polymerase sigma factor n=1 Tax=Chondromyces crocatus TaxID=52 RepID=UPI00067BB85E|nr:RNA polymerase sigma factor [Chondromyces crocatus]
MTAPADAHDVRALEALQRGERKLALDTLMAAYGVQLYRYCYSIMGSRPLADDVHQTVFLQAYQGLESFEGTTFRAWLYAIAHNRCLDALKTNRRHDKRFRTQGYVPEEADERPSAEECIMRDFATAKLAECLDELSYPVRMAVILRFQEGFSYEEMSRICGERSATLKMRVARSMPVLRKCLEGKGVLR